MHITRDNEYSEEQNFEAKRCDLARQYPGVHKEANCSETFVQGIKDESPGHERHQTNTSTRRRCSATFVTRRSQRRTSIKYLPPLSVLFFYFFSLLFSFLFLPVFFTFRPFVAQLIIASPTPCATLARVNRRETALNAETAPAIGDTRAPKRCRISQPSFTLQPTRLCFI